MCGILGYTGRTPCLELLLDGLEKLEYRGYDSAGVALLQGDEVRALRSVGNLERLRQVIAGTEQRGAVTVAERAATAGIGHTRWATHGAVTEDNAHPHADPSGAFHIVLNGIIENYQDLRAQVGQGSFASDTDAEVVAHLIAEYYTGDLVQAVARTCHVLEGHYAFVVLSAAEPGRLVATRQQCPLLIGIGDGQHLVASSANVLAGHAHSIMTLNDGDVAALTEDDLRVVDADGRLVTRPLGVLHGAEAAGHKAGHATYMLKEIHEQPTAIAATLASRLSPDVSLPELRTLTEIGSPRRVVLIGCGSSYHAGLVGRHAIEEWAGVPVELEVASEFRSRRPTVTEGDLVVGITQSGETADTLAALRLARSRGAAVLGITNVADSQISREVDALLLTRAGTEIGVAATKSYLVQLVAVYLLALELSRLSGGLGDTERREIAAGLAELPDLVDRTIATVDGPAKAFASGWSEAPFFLFLGRNVGVAAAMEGALKLKEISYIPAEAYPAGEMKHGPIALLDSSTPVICVTTDSPVMTKMIGNVSEVRARGATVLAVATEGSRHVAEHTDEIIYVPSSHWLLQPVLAAIPLQLIAYHVAVGRGLNVDQPRNLAKTVTVE